jgi:NitT/TauT family transport system substrate-binding protein
MRKIFIAIFLVIAICVVGFAGCNHGELKTVKLCEVTHSIFYAPQYVAIALGYFEDEGLEIELTNGGGADKVAAALLSGDADIGLCGPEATVYVYNQGQTDYLVNFAQLTQCDGSFLLAREPDPDFEITDVIGTLIVGGRKGGMPEMSLEWVLKQNGIIPGVDVTVDTSIAFDAMSGGFVGASAIMSRCSNRMRRRSRARASAMSLCPSAK